MSEKRVKILNRVFSSLWWILFALLALLMIQILCAKLEGRVPRIFGWSVMQIVTGSMEDTIPTGSYILVKDVPPEQIEEEDIISFYSDDPRIFGLPNTHRVVEIKETDDGREFVTRGDANSSNDTVTAKSDRLIGVYVTSLGFLNDFSSFLESGGIYMIIAVIWIGTAAMMIYTVYRKQKKENEE